MIKKVQVYKRERVMMKRRRRSDEEREDHDAKEIGIFVVIWYYLYGKLFIYEVNIQSL